MRRHIRRSRPLAAFFGVMMTVVLLRFRKRLD